MSDFVQVVTNMENYKVTFSVNFARTVKWFLEDILKAKIVTMPPFQDGNKVDLFELSAMVYTMGGKELVLRNKIWGELSMKELKPY